MFPSLFRLKVTFISAVKTEFRADYASFWGKTLYIFSGRMFYRSSAKFVKQVIHQKIAKFHGERGFSDLLDVVSIVVLLLTLIQLLSKFPLCEFTTEESLHPC